VTQLARQHFSFAEYVALEAMSTVKHEFLDSEVWAMAGGSPEHAAIAGNVISLLTIALRGKRCRVYTSDLRIRVAATGLGTYPDASVICDEVELDPADPKGHTATNPLILVEVMSPSTQDYDRGEKLDHYKRIPSVREILLVSAEGRSVVLWQKDGQNWTSTLHRQGDDIALDSVSCTIAVDGVFFDPLAR
jgi:Uma2 family endonuclease